MRCRFNSCRPCHFYMGYYIRTYAMPIYANDAQRFELVASLYKGLRGHIKSITASCDLASLTDTILQDDGVRFCTSSQSELVRKIKKHTSLISSLRPFLINQTSKCSCGHYSSEHEGTTIQRGKCNGRWIRDKEYIPCKHECAKFETKPV